MREFRDKDFIETLEGLLMCVIGNVHPKDRVITYLKYLPSMSADTPWRRERKGYLRILPHYGVLGYLSVIDFLKRNYPHYVIYDEVLNLELIETPRNYIKKHYKPEERLLDIIKEPKDELELLVKELVQELSSLADVDVNNFGITGSILLNIHNPEISDIDLVIYGHENVLKAKQILERELERGSEFRRIPESVLKYLIENAKKVVPSLSRNEIERIYKSTIWRGMYRGKIFTIHPVKLENEVQESYGDKLYRGVGEVLIKAKIIDDSESIYLPSIYKVSDVKFLQGESSNVNIEEIVSYEGFYRGIARKNDYVYVYGKLERVIDKKRDYEYYRVVIGSMELRGRDYIRPESWVKS